jgi:hypothetical protein
MAAWSRWFAGDTAGALSEAALGVDNARAIGHLRAEAIAHHIGFQARRGLEELPAARHHAERALDLARRLESPRFEAEALAFLGDADDAAGDAGRALARLHEAIAIARASGMTYMGPVYLGLLARVAAGDDATRRAALTEGEQLLEGNGLAHNHLLFRRAAIDACRLAGEPEAMRHHAEQLAQCTRAEPLPWSDFLVRRAHALADGLEQRDPGALPRRLAALAHEGQRLGLLADAAALRTAAGGAYS